MKMPESKMCQEVQTALLSFLCYSCQHNVIRILSEYILAIQSFKMYYQFLLKETVYRIPLAYIFAQTDSIMQQPCIICI